jgi:hypothetical protein
VTKEHQHDAHGEALGFVPHPNLCALKAAYAYMGSRGLKGKLVMVN